MLNLLQDDDAPVSMPLEKHKHFSHNHQGCSSVTQLLSMNRSFGITESSTLQKRRILEDHTRRAITIPDGINEALPPMKLEIQANILPSDLAEFIIEGESRDGRRFSTNKHLQLFDLWNTTWKSLGTKRKEKKTLFGKKKMPGIVNKCVNFYLI